MFLDYNGRMVMSFKGIVTNEPPYKAAGDLLQAYCARKGESVSAVGKALGISSGNMSHWRNGHFQINKKHFKPLCNYLGLSADEEMELGIKSYPEFRAMKDDDWLHAQPRDQQAGILFRAYRIRAGKTIPDLAGEIHISAQACDTWDKGKFSINRDRLPAIQTALGLEESELQRLADHIVTKPRGIHTGMRVTSVQTGAVVSIAKLPNTISNQRA